MIVRTLATFHTDLPDDRIETDDGMDFIRWPGLNVANALADLLRAMGWAPSDPFDLQERGWDLDATLADKGISLRISLIEEVIVSITDRTPDRTWYFKRKPPGPVFVGMLVALDAALKADGRFRNVLWFTPEGYDSQTEAGAPSPVEVGGPSPG
jgi:hypothetical protein